MRLELGEVEGVLAGCEQLVRHAVALVIGERLVAVVEPSSGACVSSDLLREASVMLLVLHARRQLPAAVCPSEVVVVRSIPMTPTGKLDRILLKPLVEAQLAAAAAEGGGAERGPPQPPQDVLECAVAEAWKTALGVPWVSRRSDFVRLGGDSIKALQATRALASALCGEQTADASAVAADGPRFLGSALPPLPGASIASVAEAADYGVVRGAFSPAALLRLPLLYRYADYLKARGVGKSGVGGSGGRPNGGADAKPAGTADVNSLSDSHDDAITVDAEVMAATAAEAAAAEDEELLDETMRLRSEMRADGNLEQSALQLALVVACRKGDAALAATALRLGAPSAPSSPAAGRCSAGRSPAAEESPATDHSSLPPLHIAIRGGHARIVQMLLDGSASPMLLSSAGLPPLVLAAQAERSVDSLQLLLGARALVGSRDSRRQTALHAASRVGCLPALRMLIAVCRTAAVDAGQTDAAQRTGATSQSEPSPMEARDRWNRTALHWAVVNQQHVSLSGMVEPPISSLNVCSHCSRCSHCSLLPPMF